MNRRRQFEKELLRKYTAPVEKGKKSVKKAAHIIDDEVLPVPKEEVQNELSAQPAFIVPEDDEDDDMMVLRALKDELRNRKLEDNGVDLMPLVRGQTSQSMRQRAEIQPDEAPLRRRKDDDDFSSDDEVQRKRSHSAMDGGGDDGIVYRSRTGQKISESQWKDEVDGAGRRGRTQEKKKPKIEKISEKDLPWGGGLTQKKMEEERRAYEAEVAQEPFARHEISESYDKELRDRQLWEDPLHKMKGDSGVMVGKPDESKSKFVAPPNRYKIPPGSKWDGRVRGTGFEAKYLEARRAALQKDSESVYVKRAF
eukprot:Blabericola_migrator_1__7131@NODE_3610_length_1638_cov_67_593253_g385_i2_p1_GENE_NODE_3610_length_1638_cov_67_593253_g385_i2NODE_3610_length_1638_cov_67_593253_g385_i2_p1_ORF_typecomplete_len310_score80_26Bud13/PF09736_9/4_1e03Bud13/PF09736_9/1_1e26_NODE_3610_length_1638_cov_67_593253_g385_i24571386